MTEPELAVIIPVRNRAGIRLANCLRSLRWQQVDSARIEIIISAFGSSADCRPSIDSLALEHQATVVVTDTNEVWNRSRALNIGIQASQAPWLLCTDVDMIFAPNFVSTILKTHHQSERLSMIHCDCLDLPSDLPLRAWDSQDYSRLHKSCVRREVVATGACQSTCRSFFFYAQGYDEKYTYWGHEDRDMTNRAQAYGLDLVWISDRTSMLHQWHPTMKRDRIWQYRFNKFRYYLTKRQVIKNRDGWGIHARSRSVDRTP